MSQSALCPHCPLRLYPPWKPKPSRPRLPPKRRLRRPQRAAMYVTSAGATKVSTYAGTLSVTFVVVSGTVRLCDPASGVLGRRRR